MRTSRWVSSIPGCCLAELEGRLNLRNTCWRLVGACFWLSFCSTSVPSRSAGSSWSRLCCQVHIESPKARGKTAVQGGHGTLHPANFPPLMDAKSPSLQFRNFAVTRMLKVFHLSFDFFHSEDEPSQLTLCPLKTHRQRLGCGLHPTALLFTLFLLCLAFNGPQVLVDFLSTRAVWQWRCGLHRVVIRAKRHRSR